MVLHVSFIYLCTWMLNNLTCNFILICFQMKVNSMPMLIKRFNLCYNFRTIFPVFHYDSLSVIRSLNSSDNITVSYCIAFRKSTRKKCKFFYSRICNVSKFAIQNDTRFLLQFSKLYLWLYLHHLWKHNSFVKYLFCKE